MTHKDQVIAGDAWEFNDAVTEVFDDMLQRSIPDYQGMRRATTELAARFVQPRSAVVDLGCSRGEALKPLTALFSPESVSFVGIEISPSMRTAAIQNVPEAHIQALDLRTSYPSALASVTLAVLTLQFVPIEYRQRILADAFEHTISGGAILLVEKVLGTDAYADKLLVETYLARKGENGYTQEQIKNKRKSLEGVLVPVTADWNVDLLKRAGFDHVECYWRQLNFAAWIGVKK